MPEDRYEDDQPIEESHDGGGYERSDSLSDALGEQLGQLSWYFYSTIVHLAVFLILLLIPAEQRAEEPRVIRINTELIEEEEEQEDEQEEPEVDMSQEAGQSVATEEVVIETPQMIDIEVELSDTFESDEVEDSDDEPTDFVDIDSDMVGPVAIMGVAGSGPPGGGNFGYRTGNRRGVLRRNGGSGQTDSAVNAALEWLAAHQEPDGHWDCNKYGGAGGHGGGKEKVKKGDVAVTSFAVLAFLGAGNSTRFGKYKANVRRAAEWLKRVQEPSGRVGPHRYEAGISTMAMAELYGMSGTGDLKLAAQKAVDYAVRTQYSAGGWGYSPNGDRNDTSVAGWWIMGLKSAKVADLKVPGKTMSSALKYLRAATDKNGRVSYSSNAKTASGVKAGGGSARMTAVALTCLQFLGRDRTDSEVKACAEAAMKAMPNPKKHDFYLSYYQALGLFQMGVRSPYWKRFNPLMKNALLSTQVRSGTPRQNKGSWDPDTDGYGKQWGRVGQTALGALMLEVYYRYKDVH